MIHGPTSERLATPASVAREREAFKWLFSFADMERGAGWDPADSPAEQWKVGRTRALLDQAGAPDRRMRCVLVAGTKGKGSTAALLAALLHATGIRAGLYTQPHLQSYRERIRVDGEMVSPGAFADAVDGSRALVAAFRDRHPDAGEPTTFEITTALAIRHFAGEGCSVAVLEVGLGGRLDATNAVDPEVSIIATIGRGHTDVLGTRLDAIAREKAGIVRPGRPALLARQRPSAARALAAACREVGARCRWVDPLPAGVALPLAGTHQRQNSALALAAAEALGVGRPVDLLPHLAGLRWPGRFEVIDTAPRVVLDGAHDEPSAYALADTLRTRGVRDVELVIGMYRDKEASRILRPLLPLAARVHASQPGSPRALPAADLARICRRLTRVPIQTHPDVRTALDAARAGDRTVLVTGSLALVGEARDHLGLPPVARLWPRT